MSRFKKYIATRPKLFYDWSVTLLIFTLVGLFMYACLVFAFILIAGGTDEPPFPIDDIKPKPNITG